jgi:hypothetical protein
MNKLLLSALVLSIAACSKPAEQGQPAANNTEAAATDETAKVPLPSLEGSWSVDQLNGNKPDQILPMTAEVTKDKFTIVSECRRMSWTMKQDRNLVQFTPTSGVECGRVRSPAEIVADKTIKLASIAVFSDEGRTAQISGAGGTLTMTRR